MIGMPTGDGVFVLDLDVDSEKHIDGEADFRQRTAGHTLPETLISQTPRGGRHLYYRAHGVKNVAGLFKNEAGKRIPGVDIRGDGGYVILPPSVTSDGTFYEWIDEREPAQAPQWLLDLIGEKHRPADNVVPLRSRSYYRHPYGDAALDAECAKVAEAVPGTRNATLNKAAFSLGQLIGGGVIDEAVVRQRLFNAAVACGYVEEHGAGAANATIDSGLQSGKAQPRGVPEAEEAAPADQGTDADEDSGLGEWDAGDDDDHVDPRGWLLGPIFCRKFVSSVIAAGGVGKTALRIAQAISLATGRELTYEHVFQRCRVLLLCLEDDKEELRRRVLACIRYHGIDRSELKGWLFLSAPGRQAGKLMVAQNGKNSRAALAGKIERTIIKRKIDLICIDPFVKSHSVEENANSAIDDVITLIANMAAEYDCAIDVPHHVAKGEMKPGDADKGRGASAMRDGARLVYTLNVMSPDEAKTLGVAEEERRLLIRMDSGKVNLAPPLATAKWFRLVGVPLGNSTELYPSGDNVQTVEPWNVPNIWRGLSNPHLNEILDAIEAGMDGERYSHNANAKGRAAWKVITRLVPETDEAQAKQIINRWMASGVLYEDEYHSRTRRIDVKGLFVRDEKRPS
jgi:hypothetical protein